MTAQFDQRSRWWAWLGRSWLVVVVIAMLLRLPGMVWETGRRVVDSAAAIGRGVSESPAERIGRVSAITPAFVEAVRSNLPEGGRLVVYSPYGGTEFEFLLRLQFERIKNLLYPHPRDVVYALDAAALRGNVTPGFDGRLLVVDGTQEPVELTIGGQFELVHTEPIGTVGRLRLWRLVSAR